MLAELSCQYEIRTSNQCNASQIISDLKTLSSNITD